VRDEDDRRTPANESRDPRVALPPEGRVTDGEDLVEQDRLGVDGRGHGEREARHHPCRVRAQWSVDE